MPKLTAADVYKLARQAGFNPVEAAFATQIAYVESRFDTEAHGTGPRDDSYGLWQINTLGSNWGGILRVYGPTCRVTAKSDLWNPQTNACVAYQMYSQYGWEQPWKGSIEKAKTVQFVYSLDDNILSGDPRPNPNTGTVGPLPGVGDAIFDVADSLTPDWMDALGEFIAQIMDPDWWRRIGIAALGVAVGLIALVLMVSRSETVGGAVKKAATKGMG